MKKIICILLIWSTVLLTACPQRSIETAKQKSAQLAGYANQGVEVTRELYRSGVLNLAQKDRVADGFVELARAGKLFDQAVRNLETVYGSNIPRSEIDKLFAVFDAEVVGKFVALLVDLKILTPNARIGEIVELLKTSILLIAKAFGKTGDVSRRLEVA